MSLLKNVRVGTRLGWGFGVLVVLMSAIAAIGISEMKVINERLESIVNLNVVKTELMENMSVSIRDQAIAMRNIMLMRGADEIQAELKRIEEQRKKYAEAEKKLEPMLVTDKGRDYLRQMQDFERDMSPLTAKAVQLGIAGKKAEATEVLIRQVRPIQRKWLDAIAALSSIQVELNGTAAKEAASGYRRGTFLTVMFGVTGLLLGVFMSLLITRSITRPLNNAITVANGIAEGDLTVRIDDAGRDETGQLLNAMGNMAGKIRGLTSDINMLSAAAVEGKLHARADAAQHPGEFRRIVEGVNNTIGSLVGFIDSMPLPAMVIDKEFSIRYMNQTGSQLLNTSQKQLVGTKCYEHFRTSDCHTDNCACAQAMKRVTEATSETDAHPRGHDLEIQYTGRPIKDQQGNVIGAFEVVVDQTGIRKAARKMRKIADYQTVEVAKLKEGLGRLAQGDLNVNIEVACADTDTVDAQKSFEEIAKAVNGCAENLTRIAAQTRDAANQVSSAADQIAAANQNFSQKITEQAASVEETSSTMEEMSASIRQTAGNAKEANKLAQNTRTVTESGGAVMDDTIKAMDEINKSSSRIANISNVIEEIAFQTNLLALNAAVEAARAGEHGKGFAVVASEIRSLAQRASQSAREINALIEESVEKTGRGVQLAKELSVKLEEIGTSIKKVTDLMDEVAAAAGEQASGTNQVNTAMSQIDQVTQQNASLVEETASAAEELAAEAKELLNIVDFFKVREGSGFVEQKGRAAGRGPQMVRKSAGDTTKVFYGGPEPAAARSAAGAGPAKGGNGNGGFEEF